MSATVSVIIPCFNHGHVLKDAINSVSLQTRPVSEIIVVDDGSTDSTRAVAASLPGVTYVRQENQGVSAARNHGLDRATGSHVLFLDADDAIAPTFLEYCFEALDRQPCGYAYGTTQLCGAQHDRWEAPPFDLDVLRWRNIVPVTVLLERECLGEVRFDGAIGFWEDWEFFVHLAANGIEGTPAPSAVLYYRKHEDGISRLDSQAGNPAAELRALTYIQRKHSLLYSRRERLATRSRLLRTEGKTSVRRVRRRLVDARQAPGSESRVPLEQRPGRWRREKRTGFD